MGFVDGTNPCPEKYLAEDGKTYSEVNPAYDVWLEQDQMILSWINATLIPTVLSMVASLSTSHLCGSHLKSDMLLNHAVAFFN